MLLIKLHKIVDTCALKYIPGTRNARGIEHHLRRVKPGQLY